MLIKKDNSNSAQLIPLTTAFAMFGSSEGFNGKATMSLQPMLSTEKVFFPGNNALVIGEHQTYDEDTQGFIGINQARSGNSQGSDGGGNGWGRTTDLKTVLTGDTWFKEFNRLENWCEFSEFPNNESANYQSTATANRVVVNESTIPNVRTDFYDESIYDCRFSDNSWTIGHAWGSANNNNISIVVDPSTWRWAGESPAGVTGMVYATAYNEKFAGDANLYSLTGRVYTSEDFRYHTIRTHSTQYELVKKFTIPEFYDDEREFHFDTFEQVFTSGFTARITNIDLGDAPHTVTGDDLFFHFNNTGTNVTGILQKLYIGDASAVVTADVEYKKVENSVSSYNVSEYTWSNVEGYIGTVGGGGGYSYSIEFYPIGVSNKYLMNPTAQSTVTPIVSGQGYTMISKNNIPDYYGGALLFSGNNLSQYYNTDVDKYFVIGLKGVSQFRTVGVNPRHYEYNWECKAYKFDDTHFKKINDTTYVFFDDKLGKIYTCWDNNNNSGKLERTYVPIGPYFMKFDGYTYTIDTYGKKHKTFEINNENSYDVVPTVLDSINYINSFDPEVETNSRYIITKPANSIYYGSDGFDKNHGSTEKYSYLALQLPTNIVTGTPVYFNSNLTEITQLGKSVQNITAMYVNGNEPLTALTAIKANFGWCTNITQLPNLFAGATALKEVPDSFNNMGRLTGAPSMFMNCISLTELPDFYGLTRFENGPAMFKNCNKVTTFPRGDLSELTGASEMFAGCTSLTGNYYDKIIPPVKWESFAPKLQYANWMFSGCSKITDIQTDLSATDISYMSGMFAGCTALTSDIAPILQFVARKWYPGATGYFASAFKGCTGVTSGTNTYNDIINDPTPVPGFPSQTMGNSYWKPLFGVT